MSKWDKPVKPIEPIPPVVPTPEPEPHRAIAFVVSDQYGNRVEGVNSILSLACDDDLKWDGFTDKDGYICWNGIPSKYTKFRARYSKDDYENHDEQIVVPARNTNVFLTLPKINEAWNTLTDAQVRKVRGNFCGLTLPYLPSFSIPNPSNLFTPAYDCYDDGTRKRILEDYKKVYPTGHFSMIIRQGVPYPGYTDVNQGNARRNLKEVYEAGLIPIVTLMKDEDTELDMSLPFDMIRYAMVQYEMNQPTGNNTYQMAKNIWQCSRAVRKDCILAVHFSRDHAAGIGDLPLYYNPTTGEPHEKYQDGDIIVPSIDGEGPWWKWAKLVGVKSLLFQNALDASTQDAYNRDNDFTLRFGTGYNSWPTGIDFIRYEEKAARAFDGSVDTKYEDEFSNTLSHMQFEGMQPQGYCNGGIYDV